MRRQWRPHMPRQPEPPPRRIHWVTYIILAALVAFLGAACGRIHRELLTWWIQP